MLHLLFLLLALTPSMNVAPENRGFGESIETFYKDTSSQQESVMFPLLYLRYDSTSGYYLQSIEKKDFIPIEFDLSNCRMIVEQLSPYMMKVTVQIQDTDLSNSHIFRFVNGRWYLTTIIDDSFYGSSSKD